MARSLWFFTAMRPELDDDPPHEVVESISATLRTAGYELRYDSESGWAFRRVKEGIRAKGITHYANSVNLLEAVLPDNTPREELVDLLRYMVRNIQATTELLLIDPYLFPKNPDHNYLTYLGDVFRTAIGGITHLDIVTSPERGKRIENKFLGMVSSIKPGITHKVRYTRCFHDRFWIADRARGVFVGTSLNGIGKRYAIADYLKDEDVKEIYARFQALP